VDTASNTERIYHVNRIQIHTSVLLGVSPGVSAGFPVCVQALLLGVGLQHKSVDQLEKEIELPSSQLMGLFNRLVRKIVQVCGRVWLTLCSEFIVGRVGWGEPHNDK